MKAVFLYISLSIFLASCAMKSQSSLETGKEYAGQQTNNNVRPKASKQENACLVYGTLVVNGARQAETSGNSCNSASIPTFIDPNAQNVLQLKTTIPNVFSNKGPTSVVLITQLDLTAQVAIDAQVDYKINRKIVSKSTPIEIHPNQVIERTLAVELKKSDIKKLMEQLVAQLNKQKPTRKGKYRSCEATWIKNLSITVLSGIGYLKKPGWPDFLEMQIHSLATQGNYEQGLGSAVSVPLRQYITYDCEADRFQLQI